MDPRARKIYCGALGVGADRAGNSHPGSLRAVLADVLRLLWVLSYRPHWSQRP